MTSAITITAISRQETGQSRRVSARGPRGWKVTGSLACWLVRTARGLAPANPWFPIADVLAGHALCPHRCTADASDPEDHRPPAAQIWGSATLMRKRMKRPAVDDLCPGRKQYLSWTGTRLFIRSQPVQAGFVA